MVRIPTNRGCILYEMLCLHRPFHQAKPWFIQGAVPEGCWFIKSKPHDLRVYLQHMVSLTYNYI